MGAWEQLRTSRQRSRSSSSRPSPSRTSIRTQIETDAALFVEGLGLDSIDALELAMVLEERYGVTIEDDPEGNARIFASVRSLADFVRAQGGEAGGGS